MLRSRSGRCSRRKRAHCASGWGCESTASTWSSSIALAGDQVGAHGEVVLADDRHRPGVEGEGVEGAADRALDRVLERDQGAVGLAALDGEDRVGIVGVRSDSNRPGCRLAQRVLGEGSGRAQIGDPHPATPIEDDRVAGFVVFGDLLAGDGFDLTSRVTPRSAPGSGGSSRSRFRRRRSCRSSLRVLPPLTVTETVIPFSVDSPWFGLRLPLPGVPSPTTGVVDSATVRCR